MRRHTLSAIVAVMTTLALVPAVVAVEETQGTPQWTPHKPGSDNIEVLSHLPLGPRLNVSDIELEQEVSRPFAYVGRMVYGFAGEKGMDIIDLSDPRDPRVIYRWRIEDQDLHLPLGGMDVKYFKWDGRYYVVQSLQFGQGGPDADLGAVVLDVTDLPDVSKVKEVARIRAPEHPGGFHNIFMYKHSNGRPLLFSTVSGPYAHVYDMAHVVEGHMDEALVAKVPVGMEADSQFRGYHDMYAGFHEDTQSDRFYGGGSGGYYIYDITDLENPALVVSLTGISGVGFGHTFTPTSDGRYVIAESEYQYAPLRIFDLKPALDGEVQNIRTPVGAWTADWRNLVHNHEVRYPYVFVSGYLDGLQIFSLMDPENPVTVAYYDTYLGPPNSDRSAMFNGLFGVDVRNADGLIVGSDMSTGFWAFRMEGFGGWNGADWGVPDISSAQKWGRNGRRAALMGCPRPPCLVAGPLLVTALVMSLGSTMLLPGEGWARPLVVAPGVCSARWLGEPAAPPAYYAIELVSTRRVPGARSASGVGNVSFARSPFGIAVGSTGEYIYNVDLQLQGLNTQPTGVYIAWLTTASLDQVKRLGRLDAGGAIGGQTTWNKFLVVVTLEPG